MSSDSRRDFATATTGAAGLAAGGAMRHAAVQRLKRTKSIEPKVHLVGVARHGSKGQKRLFAAGSALGLLSTAPLGVGVTRLATVDKADERPGFWREGLRGSAQALKGRGESALQPVPAGIRATQLGVAAAAGLGGSAATRALLPKGARPLVGPVAGGLAATASIPGTNKVVQRRNPGYEVTAFGVRRAKTAAAKPSSKASTQRAPLRSFREDLSKALKVPGGRVSKADKDYLGRRTGYGVQRAAVTAAGHPPVVGPLTAAAAAGKYAPPGQERKHALRQYGMGSVAPVGVGVAGAFGGARLAERSDRARDLAQRTVDLKDKVETKARGAVGLGEKKPPSEGTWRARAASNVKNSGAGQKLFGNPRRAVGATAGFLGAKALAGGVLGQTAISLNQRDQTKYNRAHNLSKGAGLDRAERKNLAEKKRVSAALSAAGGTLGIGGGLAFMAGKKNLALGASTSGGLLGGTNALLNTPIQRKEAQALHPVKKRDQLEIRNKAEHPALLSRYGDKGPLPKGLDRETKMKAYEARYVHHGGDKADKYGRRAEAAEGARNVGLATATAGGAAYLAARTRRGASAMGRVSPRVRRAADTTAVAGGVGAGAAELYGEYARGRRASYTNSPAGVAGSALRRMRDYTPD